MAGKATAIFGWPRDPILQETFFTVIGAQFSAIAESLPKYKLVM